jgi:subtilase family serine protease
MFDSLFRTRGATSDHNKTKSPGEVEMDGDGTHRARTLCTGRRRGIRPALEGLEERTLLATTFLPAAHVLKPASIQPAGLPGGFSPAQIKQAYGFNQITFSNGTIKGDGTGQTIAIIDLYDDPTIASDLATFDATFGLPAPPNFTKVNQTGGTASATSWAVETSLDVEWAHALAPGANILLVEAAPNWGGVGAAVNYARNQPGVSVISMSLASTQWSGESAYDGDFQTPSGHNGVTFVAASGDGGSAAGVQFPAASPNVVAVGGTQLSLDSSGNYLSESGWSGSGGGISAYESQPAYQKGVVTQTSSMRAEPDVAFNGSSGSPFAVYDTTGYGGWIQVYGTSAGAPQWAALFAIADQGRALAGEGTLDGPSQTLPALYKLPSSDFHDITTGSNGTYSAGPGYDLVTGRGSPIANLVVAGLVGASSSTTSSGPTLVTPASASPSQVRGTTTSLSVSASDAAGASALTYTWSVTAAPSGATAPTFSANGTNAASLSTATFYKTGNYTFQVTVRDTSGLSVTSTVGVTVFQTQTRVSLAPGSSSLSDGASLQYQSTALDQFGNALATQPSWAWSLGSGGMGTITSTGLYTAPTSGSGTITIQSSGGGQMATASVTVGAVPAPPSGLTAGLNSAHQIVLSWMSNSTNQTGFIIQRSVNGGGWTQIATVRANVTTYTDASVQRKKRYSYRVYAYNSLGNSAYSNVTAAIAPAGGVVQQAAAMSLPHTIVSTLVAASKSVPAATPATARVATVSASFGPGTLAESSVAGTGAQLHAAGRTAHGDSSNADALWQFLGSDPVQDLLGRAGR